MIFAMRDCRSGAYSYSICIETLTYYTDYEYDGRMYHASATCRTCNITKWDMYTNIYAMICIAHSYKSIYLLVYIYYIDRYIDKFIETYIHTYILT
jgi:hypothetical protein